MSKSICTAIQQELDELTLGEDCSVTARQHLAQCDECRDFQKKQTKLRQIVGSLGTVSAPSDFEFRLRSRLARDNDASRSYFFDFASLGQRSAVAAAAALLLIGGLLFVSHRMNRVSESSRVAETPQLPKNPPVATPSVDSHPAPATPDHNTRANEAVAQAAQNGDSRRTQSGTQRGKRNTVALDSSSVQAPVVGSQRLGTAEPVFPVDASQQSLKVSLLDGRGNQRTISVPTVTFGSQRVVPTTTSYAPRGVW
jgi:hypothetical protein